MNNRKIAQTFEDVADMLQIRGDNIHRVLSYRRAAETIRDLGRELQNIAAEDALTDLSGIGSTLSDKIKEMLETGKLEFYERLAAEIPPSLLDLMDVDGLGPKRVKLVFEELNITTLDELETAAQAGELQKLSGLGKKSEQKILDGITKLRNRETDRYRLGSGLPVAERILQTLAEVEGVTHTAVAGSLRRRKETIGDIDLLVAAEDAAAVMETFRNLPQADDVELSGDTKSRILLMNGLGVDLRVLPAENWGTLLVYFTGSKDHNVRLREMAQKRGWSLSEYAFEKEDGDEKVLCATEEEVYEFLNLPYIPPTLREDRGEIEAAKEGNLPALVQMDDIQADLHMHTTWSDGKQSILEMARAAIERGRKCIAVTDHSQSLGVANGLTPERLRQQADEIAAAREKLGDQITILHGTEMEIKADGTLDFEDEVLAELDFVIASLHTSLQQSREQVTERTLNAIHNPYVHMIAHPTGRLLTDRDGADLDMEKIFAAAAETGTILEVNANPRRLDLRDAHVRRALEVGVTIAVNTDAHSTDQMDLMMYGVATAQRGWATAEQIINCWPVDKIRSFLQKKSDA